MSIYNFTMKDGEQNDVTLRQYEGKILLIVNTATHCGLTPQYKQLESLYKEFRERGLEILDFPCNQFLEQAPGTNEEISSFCQLNYGTTFPQFAKIDVNGESADPLYQYLKQNMQRDAEDENAAAFKERLKGLSPYDRDDDIRWNFTKFLVDREGNVVAKFSPTYLPENLKAEIEKLL